MQETIEEVVPKNFVLLCYAYNRIRLKDAVDFCQSFKSLFPQPNFAVVHVDGIEEVKLEGLANRLTNFKFDFDDQKFFAQMKNRTKNFIQVPMILTFYSLPDKTKDLFASLGCYLCDLNMSDWKENLKSYARKYE